MDDIVGNISLGDKEKEQEENSWPKSEKSKERKEGKTAEPKEEENENE